jgi:hypothetical protein
MPKLLFIHSDCGAEFFSEKLTVVHLVKKFPPFIEYGGSLPCSQKLVIGPYPEPDTSSL